MEVDLSKLEEGQTVKFRCGGEAVVDYVFELPGCTPEYRYRIEFVGFDHYKSEPYLKSGHGDGTLVLAPHDIIEVIPTPFDWDTVTAGMAFRCEDRCMYWYSGIDVNARKGEKLAVFMSKLSDYDYIRKYYERLTRAPEHDVPVPS